MPNYKSSGQYYLYICIFIPETTRFIFWSKLNFNSQLLI